MQVKPKDLKSVVPAPPTLFFFFFWQYTGIFSRRSANPLNCLPAALGSRPVVEKKVFAHFASVSTSQFFIPKGQTHSCGFSDYLICPLRVLGNQKPEIFGPSVTMSPFNHSICSQECTSLFQALSPAHRCQPSSLWPPGQGFLSLSQTQAWDRNSQLLWRAWHVRHIYA